MKQIRIPNYYPPPPILKTGEIDCLMAYKIIKNMTIESVYQCDICKMRYDTEKEALDCETRGKPSPPQYKIGDEVFCYQKYSDKFARRKITKVFQHGHLVEYALDKMVSIASCYHIGIETYNDDSRFCIESDFIKIGQSISHFNDQVLTLEMIE